MSTKTKTTPKAKRSSNRSTVYHKWRYGAADHDKCIRPGCGAKRAASPGTQGGTHLEYQAKGAGWRRGRT